jgi:hypothetical protein
MYEDVLSATLLGRPLQPHLKRVLLFKKRKRKNSAIRHPFLSSKMSLRKRASPFRIFLLPTWFEKNRTILEEAN